MRTTLDLDDDLLRRAKKLAADRGVPLRQVVEEFIARGLAAGGRPRGPRPRLRWKTHGARPLGGVDFADRDRLYEVMEGRE